MTASGHMAKAFWLLLMVIVNMSCSYKLIKT